MGEKICSRCGKDLSANHDIFLAEVRETCFNFLLSSRDDRLAECLDSVDWPAAILARDHTVLLSNDLLRESSNAEAGDQRIGEVLGCINAALLGKCGETFACFLCGIRKSIEHTITTGEKLHGYETSLQKRSGANQALRITTEKAGDAVLLVIEARFPGTPL